MRIEDYLAEHTILTIGITLPGFVCCETIVDNPLELISVAKNNYCYIAEICWWDRVKIECGSSIGYGGSRDPRDKNYYFAETDISMSFNALTHEKEYDEYLDQVKAAYSNLDLFPAFDIKKIAYGCSQKTGQ